MIQESIKEKIKDYLKDQSWQTSSEGMENIKSDIEFGYSLRDNEVAEKDKEIARLKELIEDAYIAGRNYGKDYFGSTWSVFKSENKL